MRDHLGNTAPVEGQAMPHKQVGAPPRALPMQLKVWDFRFGDSTIAASTAPSDFRKKCSVT
jgi:hypothetical protein